MPDTRQALLDAAQDLLSREGPDALTVRGIAAAAGCSTMNLYSRFGGKDGVVEALFVEGFHRLRAAIAAAPTTQDARADVASCLRGYRAFALANPAYYAVMFDRLLGTFQPSDAAMTVASGTLDALASRVQRAMDAGALQGESALQVAAMAWGTCHGLVSLELRDVRPPGIDWPGTYDATVDALLAGLTPR